MSTRFGIKEWAGVVDALGRGDQSVLVRSYLPPHPEFLLYPTFAYYTDHGNKGVFERKVKHSFAAQALESGRLASEAAKSKFEVNISYFARVEEVFDLRNFEQLAALDNYHIWAFTHVETYLNKNTAGKAALWLVRVFELSPHITTKRDLSGAPARYQHPEIVKTEGSSPVISDEKFEKIRTGLIEILGNRRIPVGKEWSTKKRLTRRSG